MTELWIFTKISLPREIDSVELIKMRRSRTKISHFLPYISHGMNCVYVTVFHRSTWLDYYYYFPEFCMHWTKRARAIRLFTFLNATWISVQLLNMSAMNCTRCFHITCMFIHTRYFLIFQLLKWIFTGWNLYLIWCQVQTNWIELKQNQFKYLRREKMVVWWMCSGSSDTVATHKQEMMEKQLTGNLMLLHITQREICNELLTLVHHKD